MKYQRPSYIKIHGPDVVIWTGPVGCSTCSSWSKHRNFHTKPKI